MKYGQILQDLDSAITKHAFIPSPASQAAQQQQGQPGQSPDPTQQQEMQQFEQQLAQQQAAQGGQGGQSGQDPGQQDQQGQDPNQAPPGGDLSPKEMPQSLKNTAVTVTVADLLDLVSGGKASQAHLKTESMKVQHGFKHKKMLRDEQRKEQEEQQKQQQEAAMQQQQQQGMMGGGIYPGGPMDGKTAPAQPGQPAPSALGGM